MVVTPVVLLAEGSNFPQMTSFRAALEKKSLELKATPPALLSLLSNIINTIT